jgi:hypothetical protein
VCEEGQFAFLEGFGVTHADKTIVLIADRLDIVIKNLCAIQVLDCELIAALALQCACEDDLECPCLLEQAE